MKSRCWMKIKPKERFR
eukprot:UN09350